MIVCVSAKPVGMFALSLRCSPITGRVIEQSFGALLFVFTAHSLVKRDNHAPFKEASAVSVHRSIDCTGGWLRNYSHTMTLENET